MSVSTNSVTGDKIQTKNISDAYRDNFDNIFRKTNDHVLESYHAYMLKDEKVLEKSTD